LFANDPFRDPAIQTRIAAEVSRILAKWEQRSDKVGDDQLLGTFAALFDAHASAYLTVLNHEFALSEYTALLQKVRTALVDDTRQWDVFQGPYDEDSIRAMALESGDIPTLKHSLSPAALECEIQFHVDRINGLYESDAKTWTAWKANLLLRLEQYSEGRVQFWTARANEQLANLPVQFRTARPHGHIDDLPLDPAQPAAGGGEAPNVRDRRDMVDAYIQEVLRVARKRITRTDIWREAGYSTRTEFERWERYDRRATRTANENFTRILSQKPHLK
jgi:hypothetical protein